MFRQIKSSCMKVIPFWKRHNPVSKVSNPCLPLWKSQNPYGPYPKPRLERLLFPAAGALSGALSGALRSGRKGNSKSMLPSYYPKQMPYWKRKPKPTNRFPFWWKQHPRPRFDTVDWEYFFPPPRQQGRKKCTCWAIVAVETAMALHRIKTGEILNLSVRYLVDHTVGVYHGWMVEAGYFFMAKYGLPLETDYPYTRNDAIVDAIVGGKCFKMIRPSITHYQRLKKNSKHCIQKVLKALKRQPLAVTVHVSREIGNYEGGVITTWSVRKVKRDDEGRVITTKWKVKKRDDEGRVKTIWIDDDELVTSHDDTLFGSRDDDDGGMRDDDTLFGSGDDDDGGTRDDGGKRDDDDDDGVGTHALTLIGSGYDGDRHFWKLRHSGGPDWGERGTVRIASDLRIFDEVMFPVYHPNRSKHLKRKDKLYWKKYNRLLNLYSTDNRWTDAKDKRFKRFLRKNHDDYYLDCFDDEDK